jgi:uncharacterized protein
MSIVVIPVSRLDPEILQRVIEEFILREGTDYGEIEASRETKTGQVKKKLEKGLAVLVFDDETETVNILRADDPALKKMENPSDNSYADTQK